MRLMSIAAAALILSVTGSAVAQEWVEFASREDRFTCNFPAPPQITQSTYKSEYGADLPARVYSSAQGQSRFSMTVVDYAPIEGILTAKSKLCPKGAETCLGGQNTGAGYWKVDVQGALVYASFQLIKRDARVTHYMWNLMDLVEGHQLQLTNNADQSRTFASIYMHESKLYIMEATVPKGYPEPGFFQQSLGWLDEEGHGIRYAQFYLHGGQKPPLAGQGNQGRIEAVGTPTGAQGGQGR